MKERKEIKPKWSIREPFKMQEKLPFPWKYNLSASSFYKGYPSYNTHYTP